MKCPHCDGDKVCVQYTRHIDDSSILRLRQCRSCRKHWFTRELEVPGQASWSRWDDAAPAALELAS
jgi:transcriptional regulator NrdR family protein